MSELANILNVAGLVISLIGLAIAIRTMMLVKAVDVGVRERERQIARHLQREEAIKDFAVAIRNLSTKALDPERRMRQVLLVQPWLIKLRDEAELGSEARALCARMLERIKKSGVDEMGFRLVPHEFANDLEVLNGLIRVEHRALAVARP